MNQNDLDDEIDQSDLREVVLESNVSSRKANRFYDKIRTSITDFIEAKGGSLGKKRDFLFFVPDVFILLWRLANDSRVTGKNKVLLGTGLAYYIFPLDIMPEAILGPIGFLDDLVFGVYIINKLLSDTDVEIVREHWSGGEDVLEMIRKVLAAADGLVASDMLAQIKKFVK